MSVLFRIVAALAMVFTCVFSAAVLILLETTAARADWETGTTGCTVSNNTCTVNSIIVLGNTQHNVDLRVAAQSQFKLDLSDTNGNFQVDVLGVGVVDPHSQLVASGSSGHIVTVSVRLIDKSGTSNTFTGTFTIVPGGPVGGTPSDKAMIVDDYVTGNVIDATMNVHGNYVGPPIPAGQPRDFRDEQAELQKLKEKRQQIRDKIRENSRRIAELKKATRGRQDLIDGINQRVLDIRSRLSKAEFQYRRTYWNFAADDRLERLAELQKQIDQAKNELQNARNRLADAQNDSRLSEIASLQADQRDLSFDLSAVNAEIIAQENLIASEAQGVSAGGTSANYYAPGASTESSNASVFMSAVQQPQTSNFRIAAQTADHSPRYWLQGTVSGTNVDDTGASRSGDSYKLNAGVERRISRRLTLSASLRYQHTASESSNLSANIDTDLFGGALFARLHLSKQADLTVLTAFEHASNDATISGATGSFDYDTWIVSAKLSRRFTLANGWWIDPDATLTFSTTARDSYTDSASNAVPGSSIDMGLFQFGPTIGKTFRTETGGHLAESGIVALAPTFGISGTWFFDHPGDAILSNSTVLPVSDSGVTFRGGLSLIHLNGLTSNLSGSYTVMSEDERTWSLSAGLEMPVGRDSGAKAGNLGFSAGTSKTEALNARVRFTMPLQ